MQTKSVLNTNQIPVSCVTCKNEIGLILFHGSWKTGDWPQGEFYNLFFFYIYRSGYQNAPEVSDGCWKLLISRAFADGRDGGSSGTGLCYSWYGIVLSLSHVS